MDNQQSLGHLELTITAANYLFNSLSKFFKLFKVHYITRQQVVTLAEVGRVGLEKKDRIMVVKIPYAIWIFNNVSSNHKNN